MQTSPVIENHLVELDSYLEPFSGEIDLRINSYCNTCNRLLKDVESLRSFASGHEYYGFHRTKDGWCFREWLPNADEVRLIGDFNGWNRESHPLHRLPTGVWELYLPGYNALCHGQYVKLWIRHAQEWFERIPAYALRVHQDENTKKFCAQVWAPDTAYPWTDASFKPAQNIPPLIYECHVGMAQERPGIGTYREFADCNLPRIAQLGYNTIQLMAIQEHPYYASFGYQVSNFFAVSAWYGVPEDLKYLIDKAHSLGLSVLLDVVHSHSSANIEESLYLQDGTDCQYFVEGAEGWHPAWKTKLFNYSKDEVLHFLLSNLRFWLEEYHFDGFRFDGVTSMIYYSHGLGTSFMEYSQYFGLNAANDAQVYLMLANRLVHEIKPDAITVSEEMSGMPGMCLPISYGGFGFDYRLGMGLPDYWIKLLKDVKYEYWDMFQLWHELTTRRPSEKVIGYCESHDQALVGDKTLFFRMADAEMYVGMDKSYSSPIIDTAMDLHKLIRFLTICLAGDGYLTFMGNEFGHPEWIDFPREGNGWSFHYARRQWSLATNGNLKFEWLEAFDRAMLSFTKQNGILSAYPAYSLYIDQERKIIAFEKANLIFVFDLHPTYSEQHCRIPAAHTGEGKYRVIFSSDEKCFGGQGRISMNYDYVTYADSEIGPCFQIYIPCRTACVLKKIE